MIDEPFEPGVVNPILTDVVIDSLVDGFIVFTVWGEIVCLIIPKLGENYWVPPFNSSEVFHEWNG